MNGLLLDAKSGVRIIRRQPLHSLCLIFIISVSVGVNVAALGLVKAVMFRPLGVPESDKLYRAYLEQPSSRQLLDFSYPEYVAQQEAFSNAVCASASFTTGMVANNAIALVRGQAVTSNYFDVLRLRPSIGRQFQGRPDSGAPAEVLISADLWTHRFASSPDVLGALISLNGKPFEVIGVLPRGFTGVLRLAPADVWIALGSLSYMRLPKFPSLWEKAGWLQVAGRVPSDSSLAATREQMTAIVRSYEAAAGNARRVPPSVRLFAADDVIVHPRVDRRWHQLAVACGIVSSLVIALACANLAGSFLSRTAARRKEIAIRRALGGSRLRIVRLLVTEAAVLAAVGGIAGLLGGIWAGRLMGVAVSGLLPFDQPLDVNVPLDAGAVLIALMVCTATCVICAAAPAIGTSRLTVRSTRPIEDVTALGQWQSPRGPNVLIVPQVAATLLLLFVAALFITGVHRNRVRDLGYSRSGAGFITLDLSLHGYDEARGRRFYEAALDAARRIPNLTFVGISDWPAFGDDTMPAGIRAVSGGSSVVTLARAYRVGPGLLEAAGVRLLQGRHLHPDDDAKALLVVDERTARGLWPGRRSVGQLARVDFGEFVGGRSSGRVFEVVGSLQTCTIYQQNGVREGESICPGASSTTRGRISTFEVYSHQPSHSKGSPKLSEAWTAKLSSSTV